MTTIRIAIHGAAGRMGQRLVALAAADPELEIVAALDAANHPRLGEDAGLVAGVGAIGVPLSAGLDAEADVLVDFSVAAAADAVIDTCLAAGAAAGLRHHRLAPEQSAEARGGRQRGSPSWRPRA